MAALEQLVRQAVLADRARTINCTWPANRWSTSSRPSRVQGFVWSLAMRCGYTVIEVMLLGEGAAWI